MLEMFVVRETVFFLTGVMIGIGAIARLITGISLKRLVKAASNMSKSNHPLMRLVRAKFEHGCMVSDKVQNVDAFVEKYLYEYKVLGVRLHTWRQWTKGSIWLCLLFGATGTALAYVAGESKQGLYRYGILGGVGATALFLLRMLADDSYQLEAVKTYMVDFLENTYAHRYAKANQKEIQVTVQRTDEIPERAEGNELENPAYGGNKDKNVVMQYREQEKIRAETSKTSGEKPETKPQTSKRMQPPFSEETVPVNSIPVSGEPYPEEEKTMAGLQAEDTGEKLEPTKEARIREILEEFLA